MYQIFVYDPVLPAVNFLWVVIFQGKWIDSGSQATYNAALKQAAQKLKVWADLQP